MTSIQRVWQKLQKACVSWLTASSPCSDSLFLTAGDKVSSVQWLTPFSLFFSPSAWGPRSSYTYPTLGAQSERNWRLHALIRLVSWRAQRHVYKPRSSYKLFKTYWNRSQFGCKKCCDPNLWGTTINYAHCFAEISFLGLPMRSFTSLLTDMKYQLHRWETEAQSISQCILPENPGEQNTREHRRWIPLKWPSNRSSIQWTVWGWVLQPCWEAEHVTSSLGLSQGCYATLESWASILADYHSAVWIPGTSSRWQHAPQHVADRQLKQQAEKRGNWIGIFHLIIFLKKYFFPPR